MLAGDDVDLPIGQAKDAMLPKKLEIDLTCCYAHHGRPAALSVCMLPRALAGFLLPDSGPETESEGGEEGRACSVSYHVDLGLPRGKG